MAHRISLHGRETAEELSSSPILLHVRAVLRNTSQLLRLRRTRTGLKYLCAHDEPEILLSSNADQLPAHGFLNVHREDKPWAVCEVQYAIVAALFSARASSGGVISRPDRSEYQLSDTLCRRIDRY